MNRKGVAPAVAAVAVILTLGVMAIAATSLVSQTDFFSIGQGDDCSMESIPLGSEETFTELSQAEDRFNELNPGEDWEQFKEENKIQIIDGEVVAEICQE